MKSIPVAVLMATLGLAQNTPSSGAVEGTVANSATGAGISGASVVLIAVPSTNQSGRYEATSDAAGHFSITGIAPGSYRTSAEKDGFAPPEPDRSLFTNPGFRVASDGGRYKVELKLTPLRTIGGRVFGTDGKPAKGVEVVLSPNITADVAVTDEEGRFALESIRPGSYTLIARPPENAKPEAAADGTRTAMVTTYYPSVADQSRAQEIAFRGQGDFGNYEIRMQTAPVHRVRGIVLDEEGKPVPRAELTLFPVPEGTPPPMGLSMRAGGLSLFALGMRRGLSGMPEATAISGEDGRFEFPAVRSGDWRINAVSDPLLDPQTGPRGTAGALVGRGDVDDLQVHIATAFNLTGILEWKGENNPMPPFGAVFLLNPDSNEFVSMGIAESGALSLENVLPGRYKVMVKPGLKVQTYLGQNEVTGTFPLTAGGPRLRVVLKTWSGTVRGTVERGEGATVVLVPQRVDGVALGQTIVCRAGGSFDLSEVSPGDYYIAAFDRVGGLSISGSILSLMPSRGTSVRVEERSAANVMLSVIASPR